MIQTSEILRIGFGITGNSEAVVGAGWGIAEQAGRWMLGSESHLSVPRPSAAEDCFLVLALAPFALGYPFAEQRLTVSVNDAPQPLRSLRYPSVLIYKIDAALLAGSETVRIVIEHPDAVQPCALQISPDDRHLSFSVWEMWLLNGTAPRAAPPRRPFKSPPALMVSALETPSDAEMLLQFASLGDNCELGLFQRRHGAEPMDIFRFSGISLPSLMLGLEEEFDALCDPEQISFEIRGPEGNREYILHHRRYGFQSHTLVIEGAVPLSHLIEREIKKLFFVRRLLMKDLACGQRIFVVKRNAAIPLPEAQRLAALLRRFGPNTLLYVVPAADGAEPGQIDDMGDGLLCGHIDGFLDYAHADAVASDSWMTICRNAYAMWRPGLAPSPSLEAFTQPFIWQAFDRDEHLRSAE